MQMRSVLSSKTARYITFTVFLGAIGSGLWEWMLKPLLAGLSEFGLSVATLGIRSFKDSLYGEIAQGFHEAPSLRLYGAVFNFLPAFLLGLVLGAIVARRAVKLAKETSAFDRAAMFMLRPALVILVFMLVFAIIQANQLAYVNRAIRHFEQTLSITAPFISPENRVLIRSQFAQISSGEDYSRIVGSLTSVCRDKKLKCPEFNVW